MDHQSGARQENVSVRIGGLYALQRIAKDSKDDLPTIIDVIRVFLIHPPYQKEWREWEEKTKKHSKENKQDLSNKPSLSDAEYILCPDIHVAIRIYKKLNPNNLPPLRDVDWHGFNLDRIDLSNLDLTQAQLSNASLFACNLHNIILNHAQLLKTDLRYANLENSHFYKAWCHTTLFYENNISFTDFSTISFYQKDADEFSF